MRRSTTTKTPQKSIYPKQALDGKRTTASQNVLGEDAYKIYDDAGYGIGRWFIAECDCLSLQPQWSGGEG